MIIRFSSQNFTWLACSAQMWYSIIIFLPSSIFYLLDIDFLNAKWNPFRNLLLSLWSIFISVHLSLDARDDWKFPPTLSHKWLPLMRHKRPSEYVFMVKAHWQVYNNNKSFKMKTFRTVFSQNCAVFCRYLRICDSGRSLRICGFAIWRL